MLKRWFGKGFAVKCRRGSAYWGGIVADADAVAAGGEGRSGRYWKRSFDSVNGRTAVGIAAAVVAVVVGDAAEVSCTGRASVSFEGRPW